MTRGTVLFTEPDGPLARAQKIRRVLRLSYKNRRQAFKFFIILFLVIWLVEFLIHPVIDFYLSARPRPGFWDLVVLLCPAIALFAADESGLNPYKVYQTFYFLLGIGCVSTSLFNLNFEDYFPVLSLQSPDFTTIFTLSTGIFFSTVFLINFWLWSAVSPVKLFGDVEEIFDDYLRATDPKWRKFLLKVAAGSGHPDALLVMGSLLYSGDGFPENRELGARYIAFGQSEGESEVGLSLIEAMGIDRNTLTAQWPLLTADKIGENLPELCRSRIEGLQSDGEISSQQREDLLELVRSVDPMHLANVYAALQNEESLRGLKENAARIPGWDAERAIFYVN